MRKPKNMKTPFCFLIFTMLLTAIPGFAQVDPVDAKGLALGGYDVVAYFSNAAVKGQAEHQTTFKGVTYYFSSGANKRAFDAAPEKYLPQYEGFCALAVSYGKKISVDPATFKVKDGKLYLFFHGKTSRGRVNSLEAWEKDEARLQKKADGLWPDVKKKKYKPEDSL